MINVIFKNLEKSVLATEIATERIESLIEKFPLLKKSRIVVTLEMQNSPYQTGPDLFTVKTHCSNGKYRGIRVEKSAQSLYVALADVVDHMLEILNRFGDKVRIKERSAARRFMIQMSKPLEVT